MQSKKLNIITKTLGAAGDDDDLEDGRDQTERDFLRIEHES